MVRVILQSSQNQVRISTNTSQNLASSRIQTNIIPNRIDELDDVQELELANNATLVYDPDTDKYVVRLLDIEELDGELQALDGGTF